MLLEIYEVFTVICLLLAGVTGLLALSSLSEKQKLYKISKVVKISNKFYENKHLVRFLVYLTLTVSTASSLLAAFLRLVWMGDAGDEWAYWWLTSHTLDGITFTAIHLLVYMRQMRVKHEITG